MIRISFGRQNLAGWEKKKYAAILSKIILRAIQFNRAAGNMGNFVNIELDIKFK